MKVEYMKKKDIPEPRKPRKNSFVDIVRTAYERGEEVVALHLDTDAETRKAYNCMVQAKKRAQRIRIEDVKRRNNSVYVVLKKKEDANAL